jgi:cytosine/adenosine deaminase-related metal-dependent hydrolase
VSSKTLLSGGWVLTLGPKTQNFASADVLIDDGVVVEVGPGIRARDVERVDTTDCIVMPGFVDTHRHTWRSLFRNVGAGEPDLDGRYEPDDVYAATLIGLLGAAEAGITTVVDWSPVGSDVALADAALQAHADAGLRTIFVRADRETPEEVGGPMTAALAEHLVGAAGPSTTVAVGCALRAAPDLEALAREWGLARELGMRIHAHASHGVQGSDAIDRIAERGLLAEDVTLVHRAALGVADLDAIASSGAAVSLSPSSEMAGGQGSPPIQALIDHDIRPGLGVGDERVAPGDMFAQMRATISLQHATAFDRKLGGKAGVPKLMTTRDVIRSATVDGARAAGLRGVAGSLHPGMRGDVVVLRADRPNIFPINDPIGAVVWGMDTSNIDMVIAGGRALMRDGVLDADVARARGLATSAGARVVAAGSGVAAGAGGGR